MGRPSKRGAQCRPGPLDGRPRATCSCRQLRKIKSIWNFYASAGERERIPVAKQNCRRKTIHPSLWRFPSPGWPRTTTAGNLRKCSRTNFISRRADESGDEKSSLNSRPSQAAPIQVIRGEFTRNSREFRWCTHTLPRFLRKSQSHKENESSPSIFANEIFRPVPLIARFSVIAPPRAVRKRRPPHGANVRDSRLPWRHPNNRVTLRDAVQWTSISDRIFNS